MKLRNGYMQFNHSRGKAEDDLHKEWIHIESCSFGVTSQLKTQYQGDHNGDFSQINVTRVFDEGSLSIIGAATYKSVEDFEIHFSKIGDNYKSHFLQINLKDAQILSYHTEISTTNLIEHFSIHFSSIEIKFFPIDNIDGDKPPKQVFSYTQNGF